MKKMLPVLVCLTAGLLVCFGTHSALAGDEGHMASLKIGSAAPDFTLTDTDGKTHTMSELTKAGKIVVLEWFNPQCPVCVRHAKEKTMVDLAKEFESQNVVFVAVDSSHYANKDEINKFRTENGITYPVLLDADGKVGKSYGAQTTPHMFIIDTKGNLAYQGAIDNNDKGNMKHDDANYVNYVTTALTSITKGETPTTTETKPYGCGVKYGKAEGKGGEEGHGGKSGH
ncbi:MAG: Thiol-disulfide oxidoreductase ResA [Phycisphaerae bacterium]|nr:Thiol-disulfide oxidoreductase ResA [Phycisphaerae bacterium]